MKDDGQSPGKDKANVISLVDVEHQKDGYLRKLGNERKVRVSK